MRAVAGYEHRHDDQDVRERVEQAVRAALPGRCAVCASVEHGVVLLVGRVEWRSALAGIDSVAKAVPGVLEVCNRIGFVWDDGARRGR